jgi:hypothetical protein
MSPAGDAAETVIDIDIAFCRPELADNRRTVFLEVSWHCLGLGVMQKSLIYRTSFALLVLAGMLAGCEVETFDDAVSRIETAEPPPPPPPNGFGPNFSEIQAVVFTPTCATSTCHSGGSPAAGLNLVGWFTGRWAQPGFSQQLHDAGRHSEQPGCECHASAGR